MKRSVTASFIILALLMLTTFAVLIGTSLVSRAQRPPSTHRLCSMNITAYVKEITDSGEEKILDFAEHPELDRNAWGLFDKRHATNSPIPFSQPALAQYQVFTTDRAFVAFPQDQEIYDTGESAFVTLKYENNLYDIVRKEIKTCRMNNATQWLCSDADGADAPEVETIDNLYVDCGVELEFGWIVKAKKNAFNIVNSSIDNDPIQSPTNRAADVNNDSAYNTLDLLVIINNYGKRGEGLSADINNDETVNSLDYTLGIEAIETQ